MNKGRAYKLLLLALAAGFLSVNGFLQPVMNRQRAALGITRLESLENAPPMLALTTQVLGGFRGLIANALWMRTTQLQEDGKYFEMVQLADWITKLEPHFAQVWVVQAWNMAFNISVKFSDYADRWRWVQRGMELLRDEGLRYNPQEPLLYAELAWLFQFKMGHNLDDANVYYKGAWAVEMMQVFGGPQPNFERLLRPQTPDEKARLALLHGKYKMDAGLMQELDRKHGPLDWRLPEAHAIYWNSVGMDHCQGKDVRRLRQGIYQSMNLSYQRGRLVISSNAPPRLLPNLEIVPKVDAAFLEQLAEAAPFQKDSITRAHQNFLRNVPYQFFIFNRVREGEQWLRYARQKYPDAFPPNVGLAEYAVTLATANVDERNQSKITGLVQAFVIQSYSSVLAGDPDAAGEYMLRAGELWDAYMKRTGGVERTQLPPLDVIKQQVRDDMLDPKTGLPPEQRALLRAALGLPAEAAPVPAPIPRL